MLSSYMIPSISSISSIWCLVISRYLVSMEKNQFIWWFGTFYLRWCKTSFECHMVTTNSPLLNRTLGKSMDCFGVLGALIGFGPIYTVCKGVDVRVYSTVYEQFISQDLMDATNFFMCLEHLESSFKWFITQSKWWKIHVKEYWF